MEKEEYYSDINVANVVIDLFYAKEQLRGGLNTHITTIL